MSFNRFIIIINLLQKGNKRFIHSFIRFYLYLIYSFFKSWHLSCLKKYKKLRNLVTSQIRKENVAFNNDRIKAACSRVRLGDLEQCRVLWKWFKQFVRFKIYHARQLLCTVSKMYILYILHSIITLLYSIISHYIPHLR